MKNNQTEIKHDLVKITIRNTYHQQIKYSTEISSKSKVSDLIQKLRDEYPEKNQLGETPKLIYGGKFLKPGDSFKDLFQLYDTTEMQTIHLLGKPTEKIVEKPVVDKSKSTTPTRPQNELPQTPQTAQRRTFQENSPMMNSPMTNFSFSPTPNSTPLSPFSPGFQQLPVEAQLEIHRQLNALQQQIMQQQQTFNTNVQNTQTNQPQGQEQNGQNQNGRTTIFEITIGPQIWDFITQMFKLAILALIFTSGQGLQKWFYFFMGFMTLNIVYQLFFYENEEQREIRDYQEQQRYFRQQQDLQRQRERQERQNEQQENEQNEQQENEERNSENLPTESLSSEPRGFFGTIFFVVYLFFISMYPSYEFVPSHRRVEHEHQE
eukprot:gene5299-8917_t